MDNDKIVIHGARSHNLKNIDVAIPRNKLVVITGLSGSGKSSLAFDTLYAEGQRRYVQSLSSYARQFLGQMDKPDVDSIISSQSVEQMVDRLLQLPPKTRIQLLSPVVRGKRGQQKKVLQKIAQQGYVRVIIDGERHDIAEEITLPKNQKHTIEVVVDRIVIKDGIRSRLFDSVEAALRLSGGYLTADVIDGEPIIFSEHYACPLCGFTVGELEPRLFSFNAPFGACPDCDGLGSKLEVDLDLVIPDRNLSLNQGALVHSQYYPELLRQVAQQKGIDLDTPFNKLTKAQQHFLLYGDSQQQFKFHFAKDFGKVRDVETTFEGVVPNIDHRYRKPSSAFMRDIMRKYMTESVCQTCHGQRLNERALSVQVNGQNIAQISDLAIKKALPFFKSIKLSPQKTVIAQPILKEVIDRLTFLQNVGLDYLTLSRSAGTLSGGEAQRIRLATQIGSNLSGVLYILDEPSIGLHQRDNDRLIRSLKKMRDLGNTLIVVEHDEDTMRQADYLIDVGPGAGAAGGHIVASGTPADVAANPHSLTGQYLSGKKKIPVPEQRRAGNGHFVKVFGAAENNLKQIDVAFPLGKFITVTGVSGSGKSSLVNLILQKALAQKLNHSSQHAGQYTKLTGYEHLSSLVSIDQSPIGRTPRSNPATYTGVFDDIRDLFAQTNEAKLRGYSKGRFSFNVKGGRCEACKGDGIIKIAMNFLPDVYVPCEVCHGTRYNSETLEVTYKDKNIADILNMTVAEALTFFGNLPKIKRKLQTIVDVGLGYVQLGQSATTLSGGEAQRMKLASELYKQSEGANFYILDEPTTGLHMDDIRRLLTVLQRLVDQGNTVVVIEHNLDIIKSADWVIDLGPEGGDLGGQVVAVGTPEQIAATPQSYTGQYLKYVLN